MDAEQLPTPSDTRPLKGKLELQGKATCKYSGGLNVNGSYRLII